GIPVLLDRMKEARYPMLAANIFDKATRQRPAWARPSAMLDVGGVKVGVVGLVTVDTPTVTNPLIVAHLEFARGGEVAAAEADAPAGSPSTKGRSPAREVRSRSSTACEAARPNGTASRCSRTRESPRCWRGTTNRSGGSAKRGSARRGSICARGATACWGTSS